MNSQIHIVIVDDHELFRQGVRQSLKAAELEVVGEGGSAEEALAVIQETAPDLVLLDVNMPGGSGLDILPRLQQELPATKVIVLTVSEDEETLFAAFKLGASGYVVKGVGSEELVSVVKTVHAGETYVSPGVAGRILADMAKVRQVAGLPDLSDREQEILERIADGRTNKEIAGELFLSEKTVKHYVTNILTKLHVRNRVEAALRVRRAELPGTGESA